MQHDKAKGVLWLNEDEWRVMGFESVATDAERVKPETDAQQLWEETSVRLEQAQVRLLGALGMEDEDAFNSAQQDSAVLVDLGNDLSDVVDVELAALNALFNQSPNQ